MSLAFQLQQGARPPAGESAELRLSRVIEERVADFEGVQVSGSPLGERLYSTAGSAFQYSAMPGRDLWQEEAELGGGEGAVGPHIQGGTGAVPLPGWSLA